jgi:hypothetical protein
MSTREERPVTQGYVKAENAYLGFYWFILFMVGLTIVSLGAALMGYGIVFETQVPWTVYHTFYSYMVMFPLVGTLIMAVFGLAAADRSGTTMGFVVTTITVIYLVLVGAIVIYMIWDWVANCDASTAAPHCWNGMSVRWQWMWVFFSILFQWLFMILELVLALKFIGIAHRLLNAGVVSSHFPSIRVESRQKSPVRLSQYDPMTASFIRAVDRL